MSNNFNISQFKQYAVLVMSLVSAIVTSIFWVQSYGEDHYYALNSGEYMESEITDMQDDIEKIRDQNIEIILMLGRIEGALSND